ncbi:unnamed protein product, partial [Clonostachys byssicola]
AIPSSIPGEPQTFRKHMGFFSTLAAGFSINNSWLVAAATMVIPLSFGPMVTATDILIVAVVYTCVGLSLAELVSAYPTVGGQYHWTSLLAPDSVRRGMSFVCGFLSWVSWIAMSAASYGAISMCANALAFNSNPDFVPRDWHAFFFYQAVNTLALMANMFAHTQLHKLYSIGLFVSLAGFTAITVTCLALQKQKQSSQFVWELSFQTSGWPVGMEVLISLAGPVVSFCPLDSAVHLVDEVINPAAAVPRALVSVIVISSVTAFTFLISMLYCISDIDAVLSNPAGFPLMPIWEQATGSNVAAIVFTSVVIFLLPIGSIASAHIASMMTWSLGRDHALLFSDRLSSIHLKLNTPVWALLLNWCLMFIIGVLYFASSIAAFNNIVGIAAILQQLTISCPVVLLLHQRRSESSLPSKRPFKLPGAIGWICNLVTVGFTAVTSVTFLFPATTTTSPQSMNYAIVVLFGVLLLAIANWFGYAKKHYDSPLVFQVHD